MAVKPIDRVCADIMQGKYDADLNQIIETITKKIELGYLGTRWRIQCCGLDVAEDNLLVDEAWQIEQVTDTDWKQIDPVKSATHFRAILGVLLKTRRQLTDEQAAAEIATLTVVGAAKGISRELVPGDDDEGRAPLATDASATTS